MTPHPLTRTEPDSSPSFIFSCRTANIRLHVVADVLSHLNNPLRFWFLITSQVNLSPSSHQKKRNNSHFICLSLFPTDNYKHNHQYSLLYFFQQRNSKSVFLVCCCIEYTMKWLVCKCVFASNVGPGGEWRPQPLVAQRPDSGPAPLFTQWPDSGSAPLFTQRPDSGPAPLFTQRPDSGSAPLVA